MKGKPSSGNHGQTHSQKLPILSARPELNFLNHCPWVGNTYDIKVIMILRYNSKRYHIPKWYSHRFGFFPCFSPYINSMTSDQYSTSVWVFFQCTCHSFLEILLFWCILNNGNHQCIIISKRKKNVFKNPLCLDALSFSLRKRLCKVVNKFTTLVILCPSLVSHTIT